MAATVTYQYPVAGGTVAPTTAQAATAVVVNASVQMGDTDTTATVTHNWGLSTTQNTAGFPMATLTPTTLGTAAPLVYVALGTNAVTLTKASATGSGGTWNVSLMKPHTILAYTN